MSLVCPQASHKERTHYIKHKWYNVPMKPCIYCQKQVTTDQEDGYLYAIDYDHDEMINYAHTECAEMDGIKIHKPIEWE